VLRAGFREEKPAGIKFKSGEMIFRGEPGSAALPVEAAGDHQVHGQPEVAFETESDSFADAAELSDRFAERSFNGRAGGSQEKRSPDARLLEGVTLDSLPQGLDVDGYVGKFRHDLSGTTAANDSLTVAALIPFT
jgi:hypothetical protein